MHHAPRLETPGAAGHRRALRTFALAAALGLVSAACQTPFTPPSVREAVIPAPAAPAEPDLQVEAAAPAEPEVAALPPAAPDPVQPPAPRLAERIAELLVAHAPELRPVDRARVAAAIESAQEAHQLDPLLLLAIIEQESRFDPHARGSHGSIGLMQVRAFVARDVAKRHGIPWAGPRTLLDPAANVAIGACYLGEMFDMYADPALAISAYNLGPYRVQRMVAAGKTPRPKYLLSVLERYQVFSSKFGQPEPEEVVEEADASK